MKPRASVEAQGLCCRSPLWRHKCHSPSSRQRLQRLGPSWGCTRSRSNNHDNKLSGERGLLLNPESLWRRAGVSPSVCDPLWHFLVVNPRAICGFLSPRPEGFPTAWSWVLSVPWQGEGGARGGFGAWLCCVPPLSWVGGPLRPCGDPLTVTYHTGSSACCPLSLQAKALL